jgi:protein-S-isoprenylcysteine O-methyltransferase Ste14
MAEKPERSDRGSLLPLRLAYYGEVAVALLALLDPRFFRPHFSSLGIGLALMVAGVVVRIIGGTALGKWWSLRAEIREGQPLVQTGPYRFVRHPAYLGTLMVCLGIPIAFRSIWAAVVMALGVWPAVTYRVRVEERLLEAHFGDEYRAYARRTARLIPGLF